MNGRRGDPDPGHQRGKPRRGFTDLELTAIILGVILFAAVVYKGLDAFVTSSRVLECMEAGHRNCVPLETGRPQDRR